MQYKESMVVMVYGRKNSEITDLQEQLVEENDEALRRVYLANIQRLEESVRLLEFRRTIEGVL